MHGGLAFVSSKSLMSTARLSPTRWSFQNVAVRFCDSVRELAVLELLASNSEVGMGR